METFIVLIKLLCAHLCSDFIFQTDSINNGKRKSGSKGLGYLILHSIIHAFVAYLFVAEWCCWQIPVVILVSQFAHIIVIGLLWFFLYGEMGDLSCMVCPFSPKVWFVGMAYILMLKPSSILLSLFLDKWTPASQNTQSLPNAGQWIGYIERLLILTFVLIGSMEGVGFLLAAKSVFRFGELNKAKEIRTTEYVLIGTLASFTVAILTGIAVSHLSILL